MEVEEVEDDVEDGVGGVVIEEVRTSYLASDSSISDSDIFRCFFMA